MGRKLDWIKPAVPKWVLLFLAGLVWLGAGVMLLCLSYTWLSAARVQRPFLFGGAGMAAALMIHHFGFLKIVDKNMDRIMPMEGTRCVFSFINWRSYLLVVVMIAMGALLRHSPLPKPYLAVFYTAIGLALILSSVRYFRAMIRMVLGIGSG